MGELEDYYVIRSVVKYNDDPLKIGRVKCDIPGVINADITRKEAIPWCRPFKMHGYQTFSFPEVGQLVWVLISKTNYNEFWWTYFHETIDLVQDYLNEHYDDQPDVFHARNSAKKCLWTFDNTQGYMTKLGDDYMNLGLDSKMKLAFGNGRVMIDGSQVYCGGGDATGGYVPAVDSKKLKSIMETLADCCSKLSAFKAGPWQPVIGQIFQKMADAFSQDMTCVNCNVN